MPVVLALMAETVGQGGGPSQSVPGDQWESERVLTAE